MNLPYSVNVDSTLFHNDTALYDHFERGKDYTVEDEGFMSSGNLIIAVRDNRGLLRYVPKAYFSNVK